MKYRKGFTLIELLVVISIIGLLSSVVLAALQSARQKGQLASVITFTTNNYHKLGTNLLASYNFNDGLKDSSGNGYDLTTSGNASIDYTTPTPFGSGYSLKLPNATSYAQAAVPNTVKLIPPGSKGFTISIWTKVNQVQTSGIYRIMNTFGGLLFNCDYGNKKVSVIDYSFSNAYNKICSDTTTWHNITITYDYTVSGYTYHTAYAYVDGKLTDTDTFMTDYVGISLSNGIVIGSGVTAFIGNIDDVNIYTEFLLASDVQKLYAEGLKEHPNLAQK